MTLPINSLAPALLVAAIPLFGGSASAAPLSQSLALGNAETAIVEQVQYRRARRYYNGAVNLFNNRIQKFPDMLIANSFGFKSAEFFDLEDPKAAVAPAVSLP